MPEKSNNFGMKSVLTTGIFKTEVTLPEKSNNFGMKSVLTTGIFEAEVTFPENLDGIFTSPPSNTFIIGVYSLADH